MKTVSWFKTDNGHGALLRVFGECVFNLHLNLRITHTQVSQPMLYTRSDVMQHAVPTLSPPQWHCCSASELLSPRLCVFPSGPSGASSSLCITPVALSHEGPGFEPWLSVDPAGHAREPLSVWISEAFFSWILLLISFWNLHICSCSSLMKFTTLWHMQWGRKKIERNI